MVHPNQVKTTHLTGKPGKYCIFVTDSQKMTFNPKTAGSGLNISFQNEIFMLITFAITTFKLYENNT